MAAKTYKFAKFVRQDEGVYTAIAKDIKFLPAPALRIDGFLGKPGFTDFISQETKKGCWVFVPRKPAVVGHHILCILDI